MYELHHFFLGHSYKITCNFNHWHCTLNDVCLYIYMYINCFHSGELTFKGPEIPLFLRNFTCKLIPFLFFVGFAWLGDYDRETGRRQNFCGKSS